MTARWLNPRCIVERILVTGTLVLETPTHLGNGDADGPLDMPLVLDPLEGRALLPGTSIAGALRSYLREHSMPLAERLFGGVTDTQSKESSLIVDDALGNHPELELRDGVTIDPRTRTAEAKKKFDIELLAAGNEFPLSFELLVLKGAEKELIEAFAVALRGLETGAIRLGKRKRRGFGRCRVTRWTVRRYSMTNAQGLVAWLEDDPSQSKEGTDIVALLGVECQQKEQPVCILEGLFALEGSLLIRSGSGEPAAPDTVHLRSKRSGQDVPVLSGTSLAGALRARALRIANTIGKDGYVFTNGLFGHRGRQGEEKTTGSASRLWVEETVIDDPLEMVQSRLRIDRFTGGAYPGALFNEQPVLGKDSTRVRIKLKQANPRDEEVGLLLLLLKDLWSGDLPLGGGSSIGRGRLKGEQATLFHNDDSWTFVRQGDDTVRVEGDRERLEQFVQAFVEAKSR